MSTSGSFLVSAEGRSGRTTEEYIAMCTSVPHVGMITSEVPARSCLVALIFVLLAATGAIAQTTGSATLVGTITDTTGAVLPAASVSVLNIETSFRSETQASPEGNY